MITRKTFLAGSVAAVLSLVGVPALAGEHGSKIMIEEPFARATASPAVKVAGAYMTLKNMGETDRLIAAKNDAVAGNIELHTHEMNDGVMSMMEVEGGIVLPKGDTVTFKPGGLHIMMMGLKAPLKKGETLDLTLVFEKAGDVPVSFPILGPGAMSAHGKAGGHSDDHGHGDHSGHNHGSGS